MNKQDRVFGNRNIPDHDEALRLILENFDKSQTLSNHPIDDTDLFSSLNNATDTSEISRIFEDMMK